MELPDDAEPGAQWLTPGGTNLKTAALIMPFAGIAFLWFIGVVRDGFGRFEDKFFSTVFIGAGLTFLAMMFVAAGVGAGLEASNRIAGDVSAHTVGGHLRADGRDWRSPRPTRCAWRPCS